MIGLHCLPDEFAAGFEGRLARINHEDSTVKLRRKLAVAHGLAHDAPRITALAAAAGLDTQEFVQRHTTLPCRQFVASPDAAGIRHGSSALLSSSIQLALTPPGNTARYCRRCDEDDRSRLGFGYWHRSHHLQGIDWCPEHGIALTEVPGKGAFAALPHEWSVAGRDLDPIEPGMSEWPVLSRLTKLSLRTLDLLSPISSVRLAQALKTLLEEQDLRMSRSGGRMLLSDLAQQQLPAAWLARHFPAAASKRPLQYAATIDSISRGRQSPLSHLSYLLALALLCPSAEEAVGLIESTREHPVVRAKRQPTRKYPREYWRSHDLRQLYVACRGRHRQIAEKLGLSQIHVRNELSEAGLPAFTRIDGATINALVDFLNGDSLAVAISTHAARADDIDYWLRQDLQTLRPLLESERQFRAAQIL